MRNRIVILFVVISVLSVFGIQSASALPNTCSIVEQTLNRPGIAGDRKV